ncbi:MAG TPA: hypothetical protein PKN22_02825 [Taishania sp.]|nr:hypothetical protein [Taishania sp.]
MRVATKKYKQINSWKEICFTITDATTIATDNQTVAGNYSLSFIPNTSTATVHFGANSTVALHTIHISYPHIDTLITQPRKGGYRYGFQNQEHDDEVKGVGNSVNYKYRMHDPRLGRFFAVDPLAGKYPFYSPYAFSGNRVLDAIELEGLEPVFIHGTWSNKETFNHSFVKGMVNATGWDESKVAYLSWSGSNSVEARQEAATILIEYLTSDENMAYLESKGQAMHATLIAHSHGGNVGKLVKEALEEQGWTVDLINISTPQRDDFQTSNKGGGKYLNFYSNVDLIQYIGSINSFESFITESRIDSNADKNIEVDNWHRNPYLELGKNIPGIQGASSFIDGVVNAFKWVFSDGAGHSVHNSDAQDHIIKETENEFK